MMAAPKQQKTVAVLDDDLSVLRAAVNLLSAYGFATAAFSSAEEFLNRRDANEIDCLLLDIHLGGASGIDLRRQLKATGSTLPVIFMTALDDDAIRDDAIDAGCIAFLRKPISTRDLMAALETALR
jgi:FixJ family two-component response regulator